MSGMTPFLKVAVNGNKLVQWAKTISHHIEKGLWFNLDQFRQDQEKKYQYL